MNKNNLVALLVYYFSTNARFRNLKKKCEELNFNRTLFYYWKKKYDKKMLYNATETRGRKTIITTKLTEFVNDLLTSDPDLTLSDVQKQCLKKGYKVSRSTIYKIVYSVLEFRHKVKKIFVLPEKRNNVEHKREILNKQNKLKNAGIDNVISIDESAMYVDMHSRRAWVRCKEFRVKF